MLRHDVDHTKDVTININTHLLVYMFLMRNHTNRRTDGQLYFVLTLSFMQLYVISDSSSLLSYAKCGVSVKLPSGIMQQDT